MNNCKWRVYNGRCALSDRLICQFDEISCTACHRYESSKPPAPRQPPCKWAKDGNYSILCCSDSVPFYDCRIPDACEHYEPKGDERKVQCKWLRDSVCRHPETLELNEQGGACLNLNTCLGYKPAVAPAATVTITDEQRKRLGGSPIAGSILGDVKAGDILFHLEPPSRRYRCSTGYNDNFFRTQYENLYSGIDRATYARWKPSKQNKEDIDMSGNAYFCDTCRKAFPKNEVYEVYAQFKLLDRTEVKLELDAIRNSYLCSECYKAFRKAIDKFKFHWDEWRKGDDDAD